MCYHREYNYIILNRDISSTDRVRNPWQVFKNMGNSENRNTRLQHDNVALICEQQWGSGSSWTFIDWLVRNREG